MIRATSLLTRATRAAALRSPVLSRGVHIEAGMKEKGIVLPAYQDAMWSYVKAQRDGNLLYIGDHVGQDENAVTVRGKVGDGGTVTVEEAQKLSAQAALRLVSTLSHYCDGDLDKVDQVIKVTGIVNGVPHFQQVGPRGHASQHARLPLRTLRERTNAHHVARTALPPSAPRAARPGGERLLRHAF